jgi:hypothetical protein
MFNYREVSKRSVEKLIYVYLYLDEIAIVIVILVIDRVYDATIMKFDL